MKVEGINIVRIFVICFTFMMLGCEKYKEEAPFFDGLHLEYHGKSAIHKYKITELGNKFKISEVIEYSILSDDEEEFIVNSHGIRKDSGEFSVIWISVNELEIGDSFGGGLRVLRLDNWKGWRVMVIKGMGRHEIFYEANTGFLVGWTASSVSGTTELVLVDTNADIPVASK